MRAPWSSHHYQAKETARHTLKNVANIERREGKHDTDARTKEHSQKVTSAVMKRSLNVVNRMIQVYRDDALQGMCPRA